MRQSPHALRQSQNNLGLSLTSSLSSSSVEQDVVKQLEQLWQHVNSKLGRDEVGLLQVSFS